MEIITRKVKNQDVNGILKKRYTLEELKIFFNGYPRNLISIVNTGRGHLNICWLSTGLSFTIHNNVPDFEIYDNNSAPFVHNGFLGKHLENGYKKILNFFFMDLEEMPLYVNDQDVTIQYIAMWRLKIGK